MHMELNQLRDEINRIADSSNFNGIKLFDGSMEAASTKYEVTGGGDLTILAGGSTAAGAAGTSTIVHVDGKEATKTKFTVELENVSFTSTAATSVGISVGGTDISVNLAKDAKLSGADLAKAIADGYDEVNISGVSYSVTVDGSKLVFEMTDDALEASTATGSFTGNYGVDVFSTDPSDQAGGTVNLATQVITPGNAKIGRAHV